MQQVTVPNTGITLSRFIFGTSELLRAGTRGQRSRLLEAAVDHGFTHFDTAPCYGFGIAERDLAPVLRRHRHLTVTTKVGLYSPGGERHAPSTVLLRKLGGKLVPALSRPIVDFSLKRAEQALQESLLRLGRDCVDCYLLHEPQLPLVSTEEWQRWLEGKRRQGLVRQFGLAGKPENIARFLQANSPLAALVQMPDSLDGREADLLTRHGRPLQLTYSYVSTARRANPKVDADIVLQQAMKRNTQGAIVISTHKCDRLAQYPRLAEKEWRALHGRSLEGRSYRPS